MPARGAAQSSSQRFWSGDLFVNNIVEPNIIYAVENNTELKLDVYRPRHPAKATPTLMFIHGGGWIWENKEQHNLVILPYLEMGFAVVNVEYRLAQNSPAPAAVEDCRSALRWIVHNADKYHFDTNRIVVAGTSAGGHLALMTGFLHADAGFDTERLSGTPALWTGIEKSEPRVAAIINWYGITDVADLLAGANARDYAIAWIGRVRDREKVAQEVSPLTYVRPGVPPVFTVHGDTDPIVPYRHAVRLHQALARAGVINKLLTMHERGHGGFGRDEYLKAFTAIHEFLARLHVLDLDQPQGLATGSEVAKRERLLARARLPKHGATRHRRRERSKAARPHGGRNPSDDGRRLRIGLCAFVQDGRNGSEQCRFQGGISQYLERNPGLSLVARNDEGIIGTVLCGHDGRRGYVHHLAVERDYRGQGIGRSLVEACLAKLQAVGIQRCQAFLHRNNEAGEKFWRRMGWRVRNDS
jgi:acetyl esterase/lipase/GNAT superfamily N-acetyltransferase